MPVHPTVRARVARVAAPESFRLHQRNIEVAFLNNAPMERDIWLRVPKEGLTAADGPSAVAPGSIMRGRKSMKGMNDAPFGWNAEHVRDLPELCRVQPKIHPTVFY